MITFFGSMQSRELMQMNYTAAAETLVRSWNDIAVEVLDRYQYLTDNKIDWPFNRYITIYKKYSFILRVI